MSRTKSVWAPHVATSILWLLVLDLGIALGAGLYESRVVLPTWLALAPNTWPNSGLSFWAYVTTGPLTLLLAASGFVLWRADSFGLAAKRRSWWLRSLCVVLLERAFTFGYFIPTMLGMMQGELAAAVLEATFGSWQLLNYGRHALTLCAWLCSLAALSARPH